METVAAIKTLIQQLAQSTDQFGRAEINDALRELQYSLETPFDTVMRMSLDYPDIVDAKDTAFQKAFNTDQDCFRWLATQPTRIANFKVLLTDERTPNFLSMFPLEKELGSWSAEPEKALFVDIGGGMGHACIRLREKYPNQPGRVILQDLPPVLQAAQATQPLSGIESMPHNFHTPQPVQGAS
ncbi:unnamed protein product [Aspergillus oryzae]|nr:unnamed protein product [Aspergillus oryzae]